MGIVVPEQLEGRSLKTHALDLGVQRIVPDPRSERVDLFGSTQNAICGSHRRRGLRKGCGFGLAPERSAILVHPAAVRADVITPPSARGFFPFCKSALRR